MNKLHFLRRNQTAGHGIRSQPEKDPKSQTLTKIMQIQEDESKITKQHKLLAKKMSQLKSELEQKESQISEMRKEIIQSRVGPDYHSTGEFKDKRSKMKRQISNIKFNMAFLKQKENEFESQKVLLKKEIDKLRQEKSMFEVIIGQVKSDIKREEEVIAREHQSMSKIYSEISKNTGITVNEIENQRQFISKKTKQIERIRAQQVQDFRRFGSEFKSIVGKFKKENEHPKRKLTSEDFPMSDEDADFSDQEFKCEMLHMDESTNKRKKQLKKKEELAMQNQQEQTNLKHLQEEVDKHDKTLKELMDQTKASQIEEIVNNFADQEEHNYGAFKYINELCDDLDAMQKLNKQLKEELHELQDRPIKLERDPRYKLEQEFKQKIKKIHEKIESHESKHKENEKILKELMISIPIMFERIDCKQKDYTLILGQNFSFKEMDEDKLLKVLGCIELRTNDILQMQDIAQNPRLNFIKKEPKNANLQKLEEIGGLQDAQNMLAQEELFFKTTEKNINEEKDLKENREKILLRSNFKEYADKLVKTTLGKKSRR